MSVPLPRLEFDEFDELDEFDEPDDVELIAAVRAGEIDAYGSLYRRHAAAARNLARQLTRSDAERDDLVAEAFAKVLDTLSAGGGPDVAFRAYLLTTLRNSLYDRVRRDRRLELSDDMTRHDPGVPWVDTALAGLESALAARAFARLPERWQTVLWHTEVEQETPAQVAPVLGLSPNGVAALAYRAREGLRQAYLQEHLTDATGEQCRCTVERLGAWARDGLSRRDRARVDEHLDECERCRSLAGELTDVNSSLRGIIAPAVLGGGLAAGYLAASAAPKAAAAGGAAAGAGAGAGGAAAGAGAGAGGATAGAGGAAAAAGGAAAAAVSGAATTTGGGSILSSVAGWLVGTQVGQASAAAIAAVVVGGAAVIGLGAGPGNDTPATAPAATATAGPGLPGPGGPPAGGPAGTGSPAAPGASGEDAPGRPSDPGASAASGSPSGAPGAPVPPGRPTGDPAAPPALQVDPAEPVHPLRQGRPGELAIPVRNTGSGSATDLTATVSLPPGFAVRAGGADNPDVWTCTGSAPVVTCRVSRLLAGAAGTVRIKLQIAPDAASGTVSGEVTAAGSVSAQIPAATVTVQPA